MGIQDRDYFQEDRKRREELYGSDFRGKRRRKKPSNDWNQPPIKRQWITLGVFLLGIIVALFATMVALHLRHQWISWPYHLTGRFLEALGLK
ncbi:hypothetical protein [Halomonas sp. H5]|uniref:hypothetical protein n=1 Tax=Halomonas sp. H5 TaxID=3423910 RepID=UPI003D360856